MNPKITPELCEQLIQNSKELFQNTYPDKDSSVMIGSMGMLMMLLHTTNAPMGSREFVEALRNVANILEVIYLNETNHN